MWHNEFNTVKFDLTDEHDRDILYSAFTVWICKEAVRQEKYFTNSDKNVYIDLRRGKCNTGEFERVNCDSSDLMITVELKAPTTQKWDCMWQGTIKENICTC